MTSFRDDKDKASVYLNEARQMGITVGVPDVNESFAEYAPSLSQDRTILFGLAAVRNVGEALVDKIVSEREANGRFTSIYDFVRRVDPVVLNRRSMESLIKAGAFDALGVPRLGFLLKVDEICDVTLSRRRDHSLGITTLFAAFGDDGDDQDWEGTDIPPQRHRVRQVREARLRTRDARHLHLGSSALRGRERPSRRRPTASIISVRERGEDLARTGKAVTVGGILAEVQIRTTKMGKQYARVVLEDLGGVDGDQLLGEQLREVQWLPRQGQHRAR